MEGGTERQAGGMTVAEQRGRVTTGAVLQRALAAPLLSAELPQELMLAVISTADWEHRAFGQQSCGSPRVSEQ